MIDSTLKNRYTNTSFPEGLVLTDADDIVIDLDTLSAIKVDFDFNDGKTLISWQYPTVTGKKAIELTDSANGLMTVFVDDSDTSEIIRSEVVYVSVKYSLADADFDSGYQDVESDKVAIFNLLPTKI